MNTAVFAMKLVHLWKEFLKERGALWGYSPSFVEFIEWVEKKYEKV